MSIPFSGWPQSDDSLATLSVTGLQHAPFEYKMVSKTPKGFCAWNSISANYSKNFQIEVTCKRLDNPDGNPNYKEVGFGLLIGFKNYENFKEFSILPKGAYRITDRYQGILKGGEWRKKSFGTGDELHIKAVKVDSWLIFYVNGSYVDQLRVSDFSGSDVGFSLDGAMSVLYSNLSYRELQSEEVSNILKENSLITRTKVQKVLFEDSFDNNNNRWNTEQNGNSCIRRIGEGTYTFENRARQANGALSKAYLPPVDGFTLQCLANHKSGVDSTGFGLMWGFKDWKNFQEFTINSKGKCFYSNVYKGKRKKVSGVYTPSTDGKNLLKVMLADSILHFFVNGNEVFAAIREPSASDNIGFIVYDKQVVAFDDISLSSALPVNTYSKEQVYSYDVLSAPFAKLSAEQDINTIVQNGKLQLTNKEENGKIRFDKTLLNSSYDFTITAKIRWVEGDASKPLGLIWGYKDWSNENEFLISGDGAFLCYAKSNGTLWNYGWRTTEAIKADKDNILEIKRIGARVECYINSKMVCVMPYVGFFGNSIGFVQWGKSSMEISSLKVIEHQYQIPFFEDRALSVVGSGSGSSLQKNDGNFVTEVPEESINSIDSSQKTPRF